MAGRILVVEDEAIVAEDLRVSLETLGYEVCAAVDSGEAALEETESLEPDLVLMDIVLAGEMSGTDAGGHIRTRFHIPVVYLTAYTDDKTLTRAVISNPAGYITKPFDDKELKIVVEIALHKARLDADRRQAERALRESEQRFRQMAESIRKVFWLFDWTEKKFIYVSPACEEIWGRPAKDLYDRYENSWSGIHSEDRVRAKESFAAIAETDGGEVREYRIVRKDGSVRWISDEGFAVRDGQGNVLRIAGIAEDSTARKLAEESLRSSRDELEHRIELRTAKLAVANERLKREIEERRRAEERIAAEQDLLRELLDLQERERRIIVQEIHDGFIQGVVGALLRLQAESAKLKSQKEARPERLDAVAGLLRKAIADGRRMMADLRPMVIDHEGLLEAVKHLVAAENDQGDLYVAYKHDVQFERLDSMLEGAMYRIVQESLNNVKHHAQTNHASVQIVQDGDGVRIEVRDTGAGFDVSRVPADRFGLRGIRERARLFGGNAVIESSPGKGTKVVAEFPIAPDRGREV